MKAKRKNTSLGPLERELRRRKHQVTRLIAVAGLIVVGSAAVVVPSVNDHREASELLESELSAAANPLRQSSQVQEFLAGGLSRLEDAERLIETIAPDEPLPADFRTRFRDRLVRLGLEVLTIEIGDLVYLNDMEDENAPEPPFIGTPVNLELQATTHQIEALVRELANDSRPAMVTELEIERPKEGLQQVIASMSVTFLHLNPDRGSDQADDVMMEEGA